jgi:hypothetical protein
MDNERSYRANANAVYIFWICNPLGLRTGLVRVCIECLAENICNVITKVLHGCRQPVL